MKKSPYKNLLIVSINFITLTILLWLWTDDLELIFNDFVRLIEFIKILLFTIVSIFGLWLLNLFFKRKKIDSERKKNRDSILLVLLISSFLYIDYSLMIINNLILNREIRSQIVNKVKPANDQGFGNKATNLTFEEYNIITEINWFPKILPNAKKISFTYQYDNFLPDYYFILKYEVPESTNIDSVYFEDGDYAKKISFVRENGIKYVTHTEFVK